jgi:hypothetical protein
MIAIRVLWLGALLFVVAIAALLLFRRGSRLPLRTLLWPALLILSSRAALWFWFEGWLLIDCFGLAVAAALLLLSISGWRCWIVRSNRQSLEQSILDTCPALRLNGQAGPRGIVLNTRTENSYVRLQSLGPGWQLLIFPFWPTGKVRLLEQLLRKKYARLIPAVSFSSHEFKE